MAGRLSKITAYTSVLSAGTSDHAELHWHQPDRQPACLSAGVNHPIQNILW